VHLDDSLKGKMYELIEKVVQLMFDESL